MPYKYIDFKSLGDAQQKIEAELVKLQPFLEKTTNQEHLDKLNQKKEQLESKLKQIVPLYEKLCTLAISQNQEWIDLVEKNHQIAKDQLEKASGDVAEVEEGKKKATDVIKIFDIYESYIEGLKKQIQTNSTELTKALVEYRGDPWLLCLRRINSEIAEKRKAERLTSINDNTNAKALENRIGEYKERLGVLRKRLEVAKAGSSKLSELADEVKKLYERIETQCKELVEQLEKSAKPLRDDCYKISRCKNHAAAEKALASYDTTIPIRADKVTPVIKNVKGKLKTLGLEKDGLTQRAKDHKPFMTVIKAVEKLLQETYDKTEECEKEAAASRELVKTLLSKK